MICSGRDDRVGEIEHPQSTIPLKPKLGLNGHPSEPGSRTGVAVPRELRTVPGPGCRKRKQVPHRAGTRFGMTKSFGCFLQKPLVVHSSSTFLKLGSFDGWTERYLFAAAAAAGAMVPVQTKSEVPSSLNDPVQLPVALVVLCLPVPPAIFHLMAALFLAISPVPS